MPANHWLRPGRTALETQAESAGGPGTVVFDTSYEIRFPGGLAYVMGNADTIERLVIYPAS